MKQRTVYLAGPMEHVSVEEASGWREQATKAFLRYNFSHNDDNLITILNPCRRVHNFDKRYMKRIFELDIRDIQESDIILVNLDKPEVAKHGTAMEVFYASYVLRKPVVAFKSDASTIHPFFESLVTEWRSDVNKACETILNEYL
jgi:nucleoside 2-deoxyribosyltransferase